MVVFGHGAVMKSDNDAVDVLSHNGWRVCVCVFRVTRATRVRAHFPLSDQPRRTIGEIGVTLSTTATTGRTCAYIIYTPAGD